jgi:hypothetical protein
MLMNLEDHHMAKLQGLTTLLPPSRTRDQLLWMNENRFPVVKKVAMLPHGYFLTAYHG